MGSWFKERWEEWQKVLAEWKKKQGDAKREAEAAAKKKPEKKEEEKKSEEPKAKDGEGGEGGEGDGAKEDKEGDDKEAQDDKDKEEEDEDEIDVFAVEDILNIGNGKPLFFNFLYEDWMLLSLRYELHLLMHAFRRDIDDPDRPGFGKDNLDFYYNKYFKR